MRKGILFIFLIIVILSCRGKLGGHKFDSNLWRHDELVKFQFDVDQNKTSNLNLEIRSVYGMPFKLVDLEITLIDPNGKPTTISKTIGFDEQNLDCTGDFCDQKVNLFQQIKLLKGKYKLRINHFKKDIDLYGIMEFQILEE